VIANLLPPHVGVTASLIASSSWSTSGSRPTTLPTVPVVLYPMIYLTEREFTSIHLVPVASRKGPELLLIQVLIIRDHLDSIPNPANKMKCFEVGLEWDRSISIKLKCPSDTSFSFVPSSSPWAGRGLLERRQSSERQGKGSGWEEQLVSLSCSE
jgi:hypothetical protein